MGKLAYCGLCGHGIRDWAAHTASLEHQRKLHPIASRKGSKANARRERHRAARRTLSTSWETRQWADQERRERADRRAEQGPRHFYGAWVKYGQSAWAGGHPGRVARKVRRHVKRIRRAMR